MPLLLLNGGQEASQVVRGVICDAASLFDSTGVDEFACASNVAGPDFYFESKKFSGGDSLRKKTFKHLSLHYLVQGGDIKVDTVLGLNNIGQTSTSVFPAVAHTWTTLKNSISKWSEVPAAFPTWRSLLNSLFAPKKIRFQKRSQHLSFRLYQSNQVITVLTLGPFQIGYKLQRPGKV